jgi:hypothetical protein
MEQEKMELSSYELNRYLKAEERYTLCLVGDLLAHQLSGISSRDFKEIIGEYMRLEEGTIGFAEFAEKEWRKMLEQDAE